MFETPQAEGTSEQVEITSSGRRRIQPMKYKDYASIRRTKNVASEPGVQSVPEVETPVPQKEYRRKRSDREVIESTPVLNFGDSKRTRHQVSSAQEAESDGRTAKRKISLNDEETDLSSSSKRQRVDNAEKSKREMVSRAESTTPTRHTRGKSVTSSETPDNVVKTEKIHKRRRAMVQQQQQQSNDESVDTAAENVQIKEEPSGDTTEIIGTKGRRKQRESRTAPVPQANIKSEEQTEAPPRRGRRPKEPPTLIHIIESDTQSEAAETVGRKPRGVRAASRIESNNTERRSSRNLSLQDQPIDSPSQTGASTEQSGDELLKIESKRGRRHPKRNKAAIVEQIPTRSSSIGENQSEDETDSILDEELVNYRVKNSKVVLADIFTKASGEKRGGKRKRISPTLGKSGARVSSRIAAAALAASSTNSQGGASSDEQQPPSSKKQMTLPEMMQMRQAKNEVAVSKVQETILIDDDSLKESIETPKKVSTNHKSFDSSLSFSQNAAESFTTPVKESTKAIATTPKLRGKRAINQSEEPKPVEEYSAEADDEMDEEVRLCNKSLIAMNKKKLMVALKDISCDKTLMESANLRATIEAAREAETVSSTSTATTTATEPVKVNLPKQKEESARETVVESRSSSNVAPIESKPNTSAKESVEKSISDRHSAAVAKKTKKQKIMESEVRLDVQRAEKVCDVISSEPRNESRSEPRSESRNEQNPIAHHRSERKNTVEVDNDATDGSPEKLTAPPIEPDKSPEKQKPSPMKDSEDDTKRQRRQSDMDIEETIEKRDEESNKMDPLDFENQKPKLETQKSDSQPTENEANELPLTPSPQAEELASLSECQKAESDDVTASKVETDQHPFPISSPKNPEDSWANNRSHKELTKLETSPIVHEATDDQSASNQSQNAPENVVEKCTNIETRPNVIVDAPTEEQSKRSTSLKNEAEIYDHTEHKPKEVKVISPSKVQPEVTVAQAVALEDNFNVKCVESSIDPLQSPKPPSEIELTNDTLKISDSESEMEANAKKCEPTKNSPEKAVVANLTIEQSPEKIHCLPSEVQPAGNIMENKSAIRVIKSSAESNVAPTSVPEHSTIENTPSCEVSKNDETKTTTQDFCQRIDPNKNPQSTKTEAKVELPRDQHKVEYHQPQYQPQPPAIEKPHRTYESYAKSSSKEAIVQPKEEMYRSEASAQHIKSESQSSQKMHQAQTMQMTTQQMQPHSQQQLPGLFQILFFRFQL